MITIGLWIISMAVIVYVAFLVAVFLWAVARSLSQWWKAK